MSVYNGAVGPTRAREIVTTCLAEVTIESSETDLPVSCVDACQGEEPNAMCESLIDMLPWFADRSPLRNPDIPGMQQTRTSECARPDVPQAAVRYNCTVATL